jgi:hypothetical protein
MKIMWHRFAIWALGLAALALFANRPRDGGALKPFLVAAGFPWTFAHWEWGRLLRFDAAASCGDIVLNLAIVMVLAFLCALSHSRHRPLNLQLPTGRPRERAGDAPAAEDN